MPRVPSHLIAWIAKRLELEALRIEADGAPVGDEQVAIIRDEMRHRPSHPDVAVQPEAAGHRVHHPVTAVLELTPAKFGLRRRVYY